MKRPFAAIGFAALAALCAAAWFGFAVSAVFACLFAAGGIACLLGLAPKSARAVSAAVCLAAGAALCYFAVFWQLAYAPAAALAGRTAQVIGTVVEAPVKSGTHTYYLVRTRHITGDGFSYDKSVTIRVRLDDDSVKPYSSVSFTAPLTLPPTGEDDGFDSRAYYRAKGVYLFATPSDTPQINAPASQPLYGRLIALRQAISARLQQRAGGEWGALAAGLLIGDTSALADTVKANFTDAGMSHLLAVSGTQTALLAQMLLWICARLRLPRRAGAAVSAALVFGFVALTGFSPSVSRAGVMSILYLAALVFGREADACNSLGASVLVLCAINPFAAADVGLLLSFAATLGLIVLASPLSRRLAAQLNRLPQWAGRTLRLPGGVACETAGATAGTLPVLLLTFRRVAPAALPANLLAVPVSLAATVLAALTALLPDGVWFSWLVTPAALLLRLCCAFLMWVAQACAALPFATVSTDYAFVYVLLGFAAGLAALIWLAVRRGIPRRMALRAGALALAAAIAAGAGSYAVAAAGVLEIAALPAEGGGCLLLLRGAHALAVDVGGYDAPYLAARWLKAHNVREIDAVIFPTFDAERAAWCNSLSADVPVRAAFVGGAYAQSAGARAVTAATCLDWQGLTVWLYPSKDGANLLTAVQYGAARLLAAGAAPGDTGAYDLPAGALAAGQLYYGGKMTDAFVREVSPAAAVAGASADAAAAGTLAALGCTVRGLAGTTLLARTRGGNFTAG